MRLHASAREPCARRARPRFVSRLRTVEVLADRVIYEEFAHFLSNSDRTEKSGGTTIEYTGVRARTHRRSGTVPEHPWGARAAVYSRTSALRRRRRRRAVSRCRRAASS